MKFYPFTPLHKSNNIINVSGRAYAIGQTLFGSHETNEYRCGVLDYLTLGLYPLSYKFFESRGGLLSDDDAKACLFIFISAIVSAVALAVAIVVSAILKATATLVLTPIFTLLDTIGRTIHYAFTHTPSEFCADAKENFATIASL